MDQCLGIKLKNGCLVDSVKPVYESATHTKWEQSDNGA